MRSGLLMIAMMVAATCCTATAEAQYRVGGAYGLAGTGRPISVSPYPYGPYGATQGLLHGGGQNPASYQGRGVHGYRGGYQSANGYNRYGDHGGYGLGAHGAGPYGRFSYDTEKFRYFPGGTVRHNDHFHYVPPVIQWHDHRRRRHDCDD